VGRVTTSAALRARMARRYADLGLPSWANPHPNGEPARDHEYSRITDPARYTVVHARARVWAELLSELPDVEAETLGSARLDDHFGDFDRGVRLISTRPNTLPLLLLERDAALNAGAGMIAVLHIAVARPDVALAMVPDCGCDACDWGSADLLDVIDDNVERVVGGPYVVLRGDHWQAQWYPGGGSSSSSGGRTMDHTALLDSCRRIAEGADVELPTGTEVLVGRSWADFSPQ